MENMDNFEITREQLANIIKLAGIDVDPDSCTANDFSRAIIEIEKKLDFYNFPLSFFTAEVLNVLIVDDMELSIYQLTAMLKKIGVNVFVARNKDEAISEIRKKKFDYVIVDLFLPDSEDGFDVIKFANEYKQEQDKDFKVLVISGTDEKELVQKAYEYGVDEFVSKQPNWHEEILKFISYNTSRYVNDEFHKHYINENISIFSIYKINNQKYIDKLLKEVNADVLTGKKHIIFNLEYVKIFSEAYAYVFAEVYKATSQKDGVFAIVNPGDDVLKALDYVFLTNAINVFDTIEEAVEYIELRNFV